MIDERVVRVLARGDLGDWTRAGIERLVGELGWGIDDDASIEQFSVGFSTGGWGSAGVNLSDEYAEQFGFGECTSIYVQPLVSRERFVEGYRAGIAAISSVLGPPALVSGPSAGLLWLLPDRYVEFHGSARFGPSVLSLGVEPRDAVESQDFHEAMRDGEHDPRYLWAVLADTGSADTMVVHGRRPAESWDAFAVHVGAVFRSLAVDVPLLAPYVRRIMWRIAPRGDPDGVRYVRGWFTEDECHLEAPTADLPTTARNGVTGLTLDSGAESIGERIAETAVTAIRAWGLTGPADLICRASATQRGALLVSFGVGC